MMVPEKRLKNLLNDIYAKLNHKRFVPPDPLEFVYPARGLHNREIIGLIASALAYGRVSQINRSVSGVLAKMDFPPFEFIMNSSVESLFDTYHGFVHRFSRTSHLVGLLMGIKKILCKYGSLYECFLSGFSPADQSVLPAVNHLAKELMSLAPYDPGHLLVLPERGGAAKRWHLFLRWMVRKDSVDPGGWEKIPPSKLLVPLDVHMHRVAWILNFTRKKQANLKTALEITECFKQVCPDDPVKYDFALTRLGIRTDCPLTAACLACFRATASRR